MKHVALFSLALVVSSPGAASTVLFTDSASFHAAAPGATVIEDFEDSSVADQETALPSYTGPGGEISFVPLAGSPTPNVFLAPAGFTNFGAGLNPTPSVILTTSGNEDFVATLASPMFGIGFEVYLNDSPLTIQFFNGATPIGTITFDNPTVVDNNLGFAGITSTSGVTSFRLTATNGENINTGVDNIYAALAGPSAVPEPSSWVMLLLGLAGIGLVARRNMTTSPA